MEHQEKVASECEKKEGSISPAKRAVICGIYLVLFLSICIFDYLVLGSYILVVVGITIPYLSILFAGLLIIPSTYWIMNKYA